VDFVEPDQGLALVVGAILSGMHFDQFNAFVFSRLLKRILNVVPRIDMVRIVGQNDGRLHGTRGQREAEND
jgi:hypothetical protein